MLMASCLVGTPRAESAILIFVLSYAITRCVELNLLKFDDVYKKSMREVACGL
jgi:hypothetical protein